MFYAVLTQDIVARLTDTEVDLLFVGGVDFYRIVYHCGNEEDCDTMAELTEARDRIRLVLSVA